MRHVSKEILKHYKIACSSMSYTLFAFYRLMFSMCLLCPFLRLFCYISLHYIQNSLQRPYEFPVMPNTPKGLITYILADIPSYWTKRIWHSKHIRNLILIMLICLWALSIGLTGFILRDNVALYEKMEQMELEWRK